MVVDLGYGRSPITAVELHRRMRTVRPDVSVVGVEIHPERVAAARGLERDGLTFRSGGFEIPVRGRIVVVRAFNVLRQYAQEQVPAAWRTVRERLAPHGILVDGTCDEIGRIASWVTVGPGGPQSLTVSLRLGGLADPGVAAERLPKALIHRNVPGQRVHAFLTELSAAWRRASPHASFGSRQRFIATAAALRHDGWPLLDDAHRHRLGELTVAWDAVAPTPFETR